MENCLYDHVNTKDDDDEDKKERSWTPFFRQLLVCSGVLSIYFSMGIHYGAPTIFIHQMRKEANSTDAISVGTASWLSSIFGYAGLPWTFILTYLSHKYGRKRTFILISSVNIIAFICFYLSVTTAHLLYISIAQGCPIAANLTTCLIIVTEFTSPKYRGTFLTMKAATFFWGIWFSNAIGTFYHWKMIPLFGLVCSLYSLTAFIWPESPFWLASRGRYVECRQAHRWLKGTDKSAERDLEKLTSERIECFTLDSFKDIKKKQFYKPTMIGCIMIMQYYASGKLVCAIYAIEILKQITDSERTAYISMLILDGVTVFSSYIGCILNSFIKRRTQFFTTSFIGLIFLFTLSFYLYLIKLNVLIENNVFTIVILVIFSIAVSCGPFIMGSSTLGELIPIRYKNLCTIVVSVWYQLLNSSLLKIFPYIHLAFGLHGTFLCYAITMLIITAILLKILPETKDKTLHEIEEYFK